MQPEPTGDELTKKYHQENQKRFVKIDLRFATVEVDVKWIKRLLFAILAIQLTGIHLFDPTIFPWIHP